MKKSVLKVQMFGAYSIEYEGKPISFERNTATKINQLMQILLQAGEKGVARAKLLSDLFGDEEMSNPANSLRATVFRLRRLLAAAGLPEDEYVTIKGGSYYWTSEIPYELDAHQFEELLKKAEKENDLEKKKSYIEEACELYRGEFLPQLGAEEWAVVLNVYYKNLFSNAMRALCQILKDEKDYKKLYHCAEKAAIIYPLEDWQIWQMDSLIAMDRQDEAMVLYETTTELLYKELGLTPSDQMKERFRQLEVYQHDKADHVNEIQEGLNQREKDDGAFFCSYLSFMEGYRYVRRVIERSGQSAYLLLCTMTDGKGVPLEKGERLGKVAEELEQAIRNSLRRGDMFTRYSDNQFLMLLLGIRQEDCAIVVERINGYFEKASRKNYLKYSTAPISEIREADDCAHFHNMDSMWGE